MAGGPDLTKSRTDADSDIAPSLGMGIVYVSVASSQTTSMTGERPGFLLYGGDDVAVVPQVGLTVAVNPQPTANLKRSLNFV